MTDSTTDPQKTEETSATKRKALQLDYLARSKQDLSQINDHLNTLIESMAKNPSIFSRAAVLWGNIPLWQKIIAGIVLVAPTLAIGIFAHVAVLLAISISTLIIYVASSVVLDDHHSHSMSTANTLKEGVSGLANTLQLVIESLESIRVELAKQIDEFEQENARLSKNVKSLSELNVTLDKEVKQLKNAAEKLRQTEHDLTHTCTKLKGSVEEQSELLEQTQHQLRQLKEEYEKRQLEFSEKIAELEKVRAHLNADLEKQEKISETLKISVTQLIDLSGADEEQRTAFIEKLNKFVADKEASFALIIDRICTAEEELVHVKNELKEITQRYEALVQKEELYVNKLAQLCKPEAPQRVSHLSMYRPGIPESDEKAPENSHTLN